MKVAILIFTLFLISCNSNDPKTDADKAVPDKDSVAVIDSDTQDADIPVSDPDIVKNDVDNDLVKPDNDSAGDKDIISDEVPDPDTAEEWPDYDYPVGKEGDPDCPSLLNAGFPYIDNDGKKHFCRKCDLPAPANDPQCIRNLWEINNRKIMKEWPEYYCYPLPCDMSDKAKLRDASEYRGEATFYATSDIYVNSTGVFRQGDIFEGKIGMYASASKKVDDKYIVIGSLLYDIASQKYTMVAHARDKQSYQHGRFLFKVGNTFDGKTYIASALKVDDGWKYEMVYTNEEMKVEFIYPPAVGKNYVIMNVHKAVSTGEDAGPEDILYANVNDWNFKKLGTGTILYPQIFDDTAFFTLNNKVYACDLIKNPDDIEKDCVKITREGELSVSFAVNKQNHKKVVYTDRNSAHQLNIADLTNSEIVYSKLELEKTPDLINLIPSQWDGDIFVLEEMYAYSEVQMDYRICYYSFSKNRKVCFPYPGSGMIRSIYAGVEGKYIFWQITGAIVLRDMESYCKQVPDLCLYDEFMPDETPDGDVSPVFVY
ncbi:MAG TPA: hypothetical protein PLW78_12745 [bacterium]|nr:hypothetical protein [bacterium]